jgi:hypothetical protein
MEAWKHIRAIVLLPGMVTLVIPGTILWRSGIDSFGLWRWVPALKVVDEITELSVSSIGLPCEVGRLMTSSGPTILALFRI